MKKPYLMISLLLLTTIVCGCTNQSTVVKPDTTPNTTPNQTTNSENEEGTKSENNETVLTIRDYYPSLKNTWYYYEGEGNEYASYNAYTDYTAKDRIQVRTNNGGTELVKVLEYQEGQLVMILSRAESYYRENLLDAPTEVKEEIMLKEPLTKGTQWTLSDNRKRYISNVDIEVDTPSGKYKALEVTTEGENDVIYDYYAKEIGLVKSVFESGDTKVISILSKIEENVPLTQRVAFFYPDVNAEKIYYVPKQLSFHTDDITKSVIEKAYKEFSQTNFGKVFGPNVKMNSLYLNKDNMVYVDFSKELVSEMNAGSGYETMILQSITNTLGGYYGVDKVYITVEGEPYSSGHIAMKKGEAFTVNMEGTIESKE